MRFTTSCSLMPLPPDSAWPRAPSAWPQAICEAMKPLKCDLVMPDCDMMSSSCFTESLFDEAKRA
jgi:hypothetical protein